MKTFLTYICIILDVMIFPFSCFGNSNSRNYYIFQIEIIDEEHQFEFFDTYVDKIPKDNLISFPDDVKLELDNYIIKGWYIYNNIADDGTKEHVIFPYLVKEEDKIRYWNGKRDSIVFMLDWEYVGGSSDATS